MFKQYPTNDQITNRVLYQQGKIDYLPIKEPIDEIIVQQVERRKEQERQKEEILQRYQLEKEKEQILKEIEEQAAKRIEEELNNILKGFNIK